MGTPSLSIMLIEMLKLMHHAKAEDVKFIRLGTSGGVGVEPGTVVVTTNAMNGELTDKYVQWIAGKRYERLTLSYTHVYTTANYKHLQIERETWLDEDLRKDLIATAAENNIPVVTGLTLCADDFYEGQMRLDGFFCEYKSDEKFDFLKKIHEKGVRNIEMESTCFASTTYRAGVKGETYMIHMDRDAAAWHVHRKPLLLTLLDYVFATLWIGASFRHAYSAFFFQTTY
ncbi:putative uridine phosphorylase [Oesophagostomum dentatum]|uniref:Putative uridine phosphorylase n=1 Tax=Oesophagostomum dentatum TaxID=61180 RepID=A0A0B1SBA5_OESDE|nr:putative uridine phosphorylase [Oesophagostomum dentatum]